MAVRPNAPMPNRFGRLGTIVLVVVLLGLLIAAILFAVRSFTSLEGPPMPEVGYVAMTIGVVFSLLVGITLMTLLFYSSRHGYDEQASELPRDDDSDLVCITSSCPRQFLQNFKTPSSLPGLTSLNRSGFDATSL